MDVLEKVQRRATKIPFRNGNLNYEDRCKIFGLESLRTRRQRGDLIQKYKLVNGLDKVEWVSSQVRVEGRVGHREQYRREIVKNCDQRHYFFNNRVASSWNSLPDSVVYADSTKHFKIKLGDFNNT